MRISSYLSYNGTRLLVINKVLAGNKMYKKKFRFTAVGVVNTLLNLAMFNLLIFIFDLNVVLSNLIAIIISILLSFALNKNYVFQDDSVGGESLKKLSYFVIVTVFSQLIVQQLFLIIFSLYATFPGEVAYSFANNFVNASREFWIYNTAKCIGIVFSLVINYIVYDRKIFK